MYTLWTYFPTSWFCVKQLPLYNKQAGSTGTVLNKSDIKTKDRAELDKPDIVLNKPAIKTKGGVEFNPYRNSKT